MNRTEAVSDFFHNAYKYPDLPIVPIVCGPATDNYAFVIRDSKVGEVCRYGGMILDRRKDFWDMYYFDHREEINEKFGVPVDEDYRMQDAVTAETVSEYLDGIASKAFSMAIILYISTDTEDETKKFEYKGE